MLVDVSFFVAMGCKEEMKKEALVNSEVRQVSKEGQGLVEGISWPRPQNKSPTMQYSKTYTQSTSNSHVFHILPHDDIFTRVEYDFNVL
jgi:hypothetical protein